MDQLNSVLEHYLSVVQLINGETDYISINKILETKAHNLKGQVSAYGQEYQLWLNEMEEFKKKMATLDPASVEYKAAEEGYKAAQAAANEAQDAMYSSAIEWAETMKETIVNEFAAAGEEL
jgi:hypothetical protein